MEKKVGVFLTGGGAKGAFEIGFLKALEEFSIKPNVICGSSSGAIIGAGATYLDSYQLLEYWKMITLEDVFHISSQAIEKYDGYRRILVLWRELIKGCLKRRELLSMDIVRELLYQALDEKRIRESSIDFGITTTQLSTLQSLKVWKEDMDENQLLEYIIASMYLPIFKFEKLIDQHYYVDMAAFRKFPYDMLCERDCKDVYLVHIGAPDIGRTIRTAKNVFDKDVDVHIIYMEKKPSLLDFSKEQTMKSYQDGYQTTMKILTKKNF